MGVPGHADALIPFGELLPCRGKALVLVKEVMGDFMGEHEEGNLFEVVAILFLCWCNDRDFVDAAHDLVEGLGAKMVSKQSGFENRRVVLVALLKDEAADGGVDEVGLALGTFLHGGLDVAALQLQARELFRLFH